MTDHKCAPAGRSRRRDHWDCAECGLRWYSLGLPWWTRLSRIFEGNDGLNALERRYLARRYERQMRPRRTDERGAR